MKVLLSILLILFISVNCLHAQKVNKDLEPFSEIKIGPGINLELIKSDQHKIELVSDSELVNQVIIENNRHELKVYFGYSNFSMNDSDFANSKYTLENTPYEGIKVYAKLYFTEIESIDFRGDHKLFSKDVLESNELLIKIFGDNEVKFKGVKANKLTIKSYGENELEVLSGEASELTIKAYGENDLTMDGVKTDRTSLTSMGESDIDVHATSKLKVTVLGEGNIRYKGSPQIKEFNLGEASIAHIDDSTY